MFIQWSRLHILQLSLGPPLRDQLTLPLFQSVEVISSLLRKQLTISFAPSVYTIRLLLLVVEAGTMCAMPENNLQTSTTPPEAVL